MLKRLNRPVQLQLQLQLQLDCLPVLKRQRPQQQPRQHHLLLQEDRDLILDRILGLVQVQLKEVEEGSGRHGLFKGVITHDV